MAAYFAHTASSGRAFTPRSQVQKLAIQAADQAYCLSLTLKAHNQLDRMLLPERKDASDQPCWIPLRPQSAELVHTFNGELGRQLDALMQTLGALERLTIEASQDQEMDRSDALV